MTRALLVGAAGFAGTLSRYGVDAWLNARARGPFPWSTFTINVTGCFALGLLVAVFTERVVPHPHVRTALTIGFLGAYTTFSTFAFETMRLAEDGARATALGYVAASIAAGLIAVVAGTAIGRAL